MYCKASISARCVMLRLYKPLACCFHYNAQAVHQAHLAILLPDWRLHPCLPMRCRSSRPTTGQISFRERELALRSAQRHGCLQGMLCPGNGFERLLRPGGFKRTSGRSASHPVHRCVTEHHFPLSWPGMAGRLRHATRRVLPGRAHHRRSPATLAHAGPGQQLIAVQRVSVCSATWLFPHANPRKLAVVLTG